MSTLPHVIYIVKAIPIKNPEVLGLEIEKLIPATNKTGQRKF